MDSLVSNVGADVSAECMASVKGGVCVCPSLQMSFIARLVQQLDSLQASEQTTTPLQAGGK